MAEQQPFTTDDLCYSAGDFRSMMNGLVCAEGVGSETDLVVDYTTPASGNIEVSAGHAFIANDFAPDGMYHVYNDDVVTLAVPLNSTGVARSDVVWAQVCDNEFVPGSSTFTLIYDDDNPTATPPADGCTYYLLANLTVANGAGTGGTDIEVGTTPITVTTVGFQLCGDDGGWAQDSASLNFPSIAAGGIQSLTLQVAGATVGNPVAVGPSSALPAGLMWGGYVTATSTVTIRLHNTTGAPIDPGAQTWTVAVKIR